MKAQFVNEEKARNEDYIAKIRSNNFFKKNKSLSGMMKLLPGENLITKDAKDKKIVLNSSSMK